jgi:hypothetical protein
VTTSGSKAHHCVRLAGMHLVREPYTAPPWTRCLGVLPPATRVRLANLPTPVHRWGVPALAELGLRTLVKRDDASAFDTSGERSQPRPHTRHITATTAT